MPSPLARNSYSIYKPLASSSSSLSSLSRYETAPPLVPFPDQEATGQCYTCQRRVEHLLDKGCSYHKCAEESCGNLKSPGRRYCDQHKCKNELCESPRQACRRHCLIHTCKVTGCPNGKSAGENYCTRHGCQVMQCRRKSDEWASFCYSHRCKVFPCDGHTDVADSDFCRKHSISTAARYDMELDEIDGGEDGGDDEDRGAY